MLQQTTVAAAIPRWEAFLARFPDVASLAAAREDDVLAAWSGLGYYARARNLHRAARLVASARAFPRSAAEWRRLPGVGEYTAAAVASIAFGERVAVVDGNVARVLSRAWALSASPKSASGAARLKELASSLLPQRGAGDHNQAVMELGATVCLPKGPLCPTCPLRGVCVARAEGNPEAYPPASPRPAPRRLRLAAGLALRRGRVVLVADDELVKGHWTLPAVRVGKGGDAARALADAWPEAAGRIAASVERVGAVSHAVLDRRYTIEVYAVREGGKAASGGPVRLADRTNPALPHGGALVKALRLLAPAPSSRASGPRGPSPRRRNGR